jgi:hypothetical protein
MKKTFLRNPLSLVAFFMLAACIIYGRFLLPRWLTYDHLSILSWDVFGYYLYLPAHFIHHDLGIKDFSWLQQILDKYSPTIGFYQAYQGPLDLYVMKYPMGMAILFAPFFFIAHILAGLGGFVQDGFSLPYQISIALGCVVYGIIGLWILRKVLLRFFTDSVTAIVMILVVLGTNYFQLTTYDSAMVHNSLFTIYACILWFTIRWHDDPKWKYAIPLGLFIGLATLIRPTEIISALIPVCWGIWDKECRREKWSLVVGHWSLVVGMGIAAVCLIMLQPVYWKIYSGSFIYYSYEEGERLKFLAPYIMFVLFSWKKGWLIYAPMMVFAVTGFYFLFRSNRRIFLSTFLFFAVNLLIISSWTTWWYGGSLGQRSLMQSYAVLALPFGYFIRWLLQRKWWLKILFILISGFFIWLNLFQTWQYMTWIIDPSRMTQKYYWAVFGRTSVPEGAHKYLEIVETFDREYLDNGKEYEKRVLADYTFEYEGADKDAHLRKGITRFGEYAYVMDSTVPYSPGIKSAVGGIAPAANSWIRLHVWIFPESDMKESPASLVISVIRDGKNYKYKTIDLDQEELGIGEWNELTMDYELPWDCGAGDLIAAYIWNRGKKTFYFDDLTVELLEPMK